MQNLIEARFQALLTAAGWVDLGDFEWSLGYCQSDAVAFSGVLADCAPLVRRLMPGPAGEAIIAGFSRDTFGGIAVRKSHYGPGIASMAVAIDEQDAFLTEDDDSAHETLQKTIAQEHLRDLEVLLSEDLKRQERLLVRAGHDVYEALHPGFWSKFPDRGDDVLMRRIERASFAIEWRLSKLDGAFDTEEPTDLHQQLADGLRGAFVTCHALDEYDEEIASSPSYATLLSKEDWAGCEIRETMRDSLGDIAPAIRTFLASAETA